MNRRFELPEQYEQHEQRTTDKGQLTAPYALCAMRFF
jgi:hypothetical protein